MDTDMNITVPAANAFSKPEKFKGSRASGAGFGFNSIPLTFMQNCAMASRSGLGTLIGSFRCCTSFVEKVASVQDSATTSRSGVGTLIGPLCCCTSFVEKEVSVQDSAMTSMSGVETLVG